MPLVLSLVIMLLLYLLLRTVVLYTLHL